MVGTEPKYDFKGKIKELETYLEENDVESNELKKINKVLFNLRNIDVIIENIDEELIIDDIENDYNNLKSYCNYFIQGNNNYISNIFIYKTNNLSLDKNVLINNFYSKLFKLI